MSKKIEYARGALHGAIAVLVGAGWTDQQIEALVDDALAEAREDEDVPS